MRVPFLVASLLLAALGRAHAQSIQKEFDRESTLSGMPRFIQELRIQSRIAEHLKTLGDTSKVAYEIWSVLPRSPSHTSEVWFARSSQFVCRFQVEQIRTPGRDIVELTNAATACFNRQRAQTEGVKREFEEAAAPTGTGSAPKRDAALSSGDQERLSALVGAATALSGEGFDGRP